jgi:hypothetical protein
MEENQLLALWESYDRKLSQNLRLHRQNAEEITKIKVKSLLSGMQPIKIFAILVGIIWVGFLDLIVINVWAFASPMFLISIGFHILLTKLSIGVYLYQLVLINLVDINEPILDTQEKIAKLKSSTIWITRLLFLQLPAWTVFYWTKDLFQSINAFQISIMVGVALGMAYLGVWLFRNIRFENRDKKWFKFLLSGKEWDPMMKSADLLDQIEEAKKEG